MKKIGSKINPFDFDEMEGCIDEREPINPFMNDKLLSNDKSKEELIPKISNIGSTIPPIDTISMLKGKESDPMKIGKAQTNPFFEIETERGSDVQENQDSPKYSSEILEEPPKYKENRKRYVGSPDFALVKPRKILKRVPNKVLCIAENPLLKGKEERVKSENYIEIPIKGVKGDVVDIE